MGYKDHTASLPQIDFSVVVVSDSRNEKTDESGKHACKIIEKKYPVKELLFVRNNPKEVKKAIESAKGRVIVTIGGTGIGKKDITVDVASKIAKKELPGFGEIFRLLSFQKIGSGAIMSRAFCGVAGKKVIFCLPGSKNAVDIAVRDIILKEAPHIVSHGI